MIESAHPVPLDFSAAASLLRSLISSRKLLKDELGRRDVSKAFDLVGQAAESGPDSERLEAISLLGKAAEISKPVASLAHQYLEGGLLSPLPSVGSWGTADDRYYLARGIAISRASWITSYAAVELARAEVAEKTSRNVWADIAITRAENLATFLEVVSSSLFQDSQEQKYSTDTAARKLNRITVAIIEKVSLVDVPTGEGFGRAFSDLVLAGGDRTGPENKLLREETGITSFDLLIQILRLRFDATLDFEIYRAAKVILNWWAPATPPNSILERARRTVQIAMNAIHVLARQGISQLSLRQSLVSAFGAEIVAKVGTDIVVKDPSLDPAIASWLSSGRDLGRTKSNLAVRELTDRNFDELVANLLLAIESHETDELNLVARSIEMLEPTLAATLKTAATRSRLISQWANAIADHQKLSLHEDRGALTKFDPALHETSGNDQVSATVRVKRPAVVKRVDGRPTTIVLKGEIEPL